METTLNNTATVLGTYNEIPTTLTSEVLVTTLLSGLTVTKTADKEVWADGNLTYTITVDNQTTETYTSPVITDILDKDLVTLLTDTIKINETIATTSDYQYDEATGKLTVNLSDIAPSSKTTVTFQVAKK